MVYTYNSVDYSFSELAESKFPGNNDITHNLTLSNTYERGNWQFSAGWNFRTGVPFTPITGFDAIEGDITTIVWMSLHNTALRYLPVKTTAVF